MSKKANYNAETDYMKITPYGITYMRKGEKIHKDFDINYYDLRRQLKGMPYNQFYESIGGKDAYNETVERMSMPSICKLFYRMFCDSLKLPTPKGLVNEYISRYCDKIDENNYILKEKYNKENQEAVVFSYNDIAGRILRGYCSFCREIMLLASFAKYHYKLNVYYNYYDDFVNGIDLIIKYNKKKYGIATYVGTKNSQKHRNYKQNTFYKDEKLEIIEMPAYLSNNKYKNTIKMGDIAVYSEDYIDFILKKLS